MSKNAWKWILLHYEILLVPLKVSKRISEQRHSMFWLHLEAISLENAFNTSLEKMLSQFSTAKIENLFRWCFNPSYWMNSLKKFWDNSDNTVRHAWDSKVLISWTKWGDCEHFFQSSKFRYILGIWVFSLRIRVPRK